MVFEGKGAKKAREWEKKGGYKKEKKIKVLQMKREGAVVVMSYEQDGKNKTAIVAPGTKGKSGHATFFGSGAGGGFVETELIAYTEDEFRRKLAKEIGCEPEDIPRLAEVKTPSMVTNIYEGIDEIIDDLLKQYADSTKIPSRDFEKAFAEIETVAQRHVEARDIMQLTEPFKEIHYDLYDSNKEYLDKSEIEMAKKSKERFFRNIERFDA